MSPKEATEVIYKNYQRICWDNPELSDALDAVLKVAESTIAIEVVSDEATE